ncbi:unnamed protein product, partial [marine sediment metagenome]
ATWNVFVDGNYAYMASGGPGIQIINISDPASPKLTGSYNTPGRDSDVFISGGYAYVTDEYVTSKTTGLQILNISNPSNPTLTGSYNIAPKDANSVFVSGNYAFMADDDGLRVLDVTDPANPILAGLKSITYGFRDVYVSGSYVYVTSGALGLLIFDVSGLP